MEKNQKRSTLNRILCKPYQRTEPFTTYPVHVAYTLIIITSLFPYLNTLFNGFVWDDHEFIIKNQFIKDWHNLFIIFTPQYLKLSWEQIDVNRPVMLVSLFLDYSIWKLNPFGYHLTNILLHTANCLALYHLLRLLFPTRLLPIIGSILFAVHPIHTEAVNAINFREDLLVSFFYLLSLSFVIKGSTDNTGWRLWALSIFLYVIALLSKEMAVTLPLIVLLYFITWGRGYPFKGVFIGYVSMTLLYTVWLWYIRQYSDIAVSPENLKPLFERLFITLTSAGHYLWILFLPFNLNAYYSVAPFSVISLQNFFIAISVIASCLWITFILISKRDEKFFFAGWFFITLIPAMNIVPILHPVAERYLYLPSIGPIILIAFVIERFLKALTDKHGKIILALIILMTTLLIMTTLKRNMVWRDGINLWSDTVAKSPDDPIAHNNLGWSYLDSNNLDKALPELQTAVKSKPDFPGAHNNLGALYHAKGMLNEAITEYQIALSLKPDYASSHYNLGLIYTETGQLDKAIEEYTKAIKLKPTYAEAHHNLGNVYSDIDRFEEAIQEFTTAIRLKPDYASAHYNLANTYYIVGLKDKAKNEFRIALEIKSDFEEARQALKKIQD